MLILLLLLLPLVSTAQQPVTPFESSPAPAPIAVAGAKLYLAEVIVFNNLGPIPAGGEIWHREPRIEFDPEKFLATPTPPFQEGQPITPVVESPMEGATGEPDPIKFRGLAYLSPYLSKLHTDSRYEVLTYTAWVQPLFDKRDAIRVPIMREPAPAQTGYALYPSIRAPLSGSIQIFENRLLFVDVDVTNEFSDRYSGYATSARQDRQPGRYSMREKRRVKLNELHYFDHPFFGMLFRVSRYEPAASPTPPDES